MIYCIPLPIILWWYICMTSSSSTIFWRNTCNIFNMSFTLWQHKLYANLKNLSFDTNRVQYLGYIVDEHGVHVDPTKIHVIRDWPTLTTLTELQSFLGHANFYCMFVLIFSHIAWALNQVTNDGGKKNFV
jgi:hypothetical protein